MTGGHCVQGALNSATPGQNKPLHCEVPDPFLRKGVARETSNVVSLVTIAMFACHEVIHQVTPH